jgi:hypothetical protein
MSNLLTKYYQGLLQQIRSEVDLINTLFEHQGLKGEGNERLLRDFLKDFVAKKYGIGTGVIIDRMGKSSKQCDIIIYDEFLYPSVLTHGKVQLFPVDIVYATVEVKTTLSSQKSQEACENILSAKSLEFIRYEWSDMWMKVGQVPYSTTPPVGCIFAYNSETSVFSTFKNWFQAEEILQSNAPDLVVCLDQGILHRTSGGYQSQIPCAMNEDNTPCLLEIKPESSKSVINSIEYPIVEHSIPNTGRRWVLVDQSKVFLFSILALNNLLTKKLISPRIDFLDYMDEPNRKAIWLD